MIATGVILAVAMQAAVRPDLTEEVAFGTKLVAFEALIAVPKLSMDQLALLDTGLRIAANRTENLTRRDLQSLTTGGQRVRVQRIGNWIRLGFAVVPSVAADGLGAMESLLFRPAINELGVEQAVNSDWEVRDPWQAALINLNGKRYRPNKIDVEEVRAIWQYVFRGTNIKILVRGDLTRGSLSEKWNQRPVDWQERTQLPFRLRSTVREVKTEAAARFISGRVASIPAFDPQLPAYLVGCNLLTGGKESILWREVREVNKLAYRLEAFLLPEGRQWQAHLVFATDLDGAQRLGEVWPAVLKAIASANDADIARAKAVTIASLQDELDLNPLYLGGTGPLGATESDQAFRSHLWRLFTEQKWDSAKLMQSIRQSSKSDIINFAFRLADSIKPVL